MLKEQLRDRRAVWIHMSGLNLDDATMHSACCQELAGLGLGGYSGKKVPETIVLDWSVAGSCAAEGLALFWTLLEQLLKAGHTIFVCVPSQPDIAEAVDACLQGHAIHCVGSTEQASRKRFTATLLGAAGSSDGLKRALRVAIEALEQNLKGVGVGRRARAMVMGAAMEAGQNVLKHSNASAGAVGLVIHTLRRPRILQLGFADDGDTIPGTLLENPEFNHLTKFPHASTLEAVFNRAASARHTATSDARGGLGQLVHEMLSHHHGRVLVRSGSALLMLESRRPGRQAKRHLNYGYGTQWRFEFQV
jgi:hypothetical protein